MNDNDLRNGSIKPNTYRATTNLNTAIENPQINMNSAMGVNIKDVATDNFANNNYFNEGSVTNGMNQTIDNQAFASNMTEQYMGMSNNQVFDGMKANNQQFGSYMGNPYVDNEVVNNNLMSSSSQFIPSELPEVSSTDVYSTTSTSSQHESIENNVVYAPTMEEKKRRDKTVEVPKEFKVILFIAFVLLIFIFVVPYIYDFLKKLELVITT